MNIGLYRKSIEEESDGERRLTADAEDHQGGTGGGPIGTGPGSLGSTGQQGSPYGKGEGGSADNIGDVAEDTGGNSAGVAGSGGSSGDVKGSPKGGDTTAHKGGTPTTNRSTIGTETLDLSEPGRKKTGPLADSAGAERSGND